MWHLQQQPITRYCIGVYFVETLEFMGRKENIKSASSKKKIAIVGFSPNSYHLAPWDDPSYELWGLPWDGGGRTWEKYDVLFEMHEPKIMEVEGSNWIIFKDGQKHFCRPDNYMEVLSWIGGSHKGSNIMNQGGTK